MVVKKKKPVLRKPVKKAVEKRPVRKKPVKKKVKIVRKSPVKRKAVKRPAKRTVKKKVVGKKPTTVKRVRKTTVKRPVVVARNVFPAEKIAIAVEAAIKKFQSTEQKKIESPKEVVSKTVIPRRVEDLSDEELALKMIDIYFSEVARTGLKRKLSLDEVVNAYFYSLLRIERKGVELTAIKDALLREKL